MLLRSVFFAFLLFFGCFAQAQTVEKTIQRLQADPNIVWIGEIYRDYYDLDGLYEGRLQDRAQPLPLSDGNLLYAHPQTTNILKLQRDELGLYSDFWAHYLAEQLFDSTLGVFADADLGQPLSSSEKMQLLCPQKDIITFDPETFAEIPQRVMDCLLPEYIKGYRMRELAYFDKRIGHYEFLPLAIAPIMTEYEPAPDRFKLRLLFWLPVLHTQTPTMPSTTPAFTTLVKSVRIKMPFKDYKVLKNQQTWAVCNAQMLEKIRQEKDKIRLYSHADNEKQTPLSAEYIGNLGRYSQWVVYTDSTTHLEEAKEVFKYRAGEEFASLSVNHFFAWDERKKTLTVSVYSFCAHLDFRDREGNFLNDSPLFYLLPHKRYR